MYVAVVEGYTVIHAFSESEKKAQKLAVAEKRRLCPDEPIDAWTWERCEEYFGAYSQEITEGTIIVR